MGQRHSRLLIVSWSPSERGVHQRERAHANVLSGRDFEWRRCASQPTMDDDPVSAALTPTRKLAICRNRADKRERERLAAEAGLHPGVVTYPPPVTL